MNFLGDKNHDLEMVAGSIQIPLLRKDFIVDEYQVIESKSIGASAIYSLHRYLNKTEIKQLSAWLITLDWISFLKSMMKRIWKKLFLQLILSGLITVILKLSRCNMR